MKNQELTKTNSQVQVSHFDEIEPVLSTFSITNEEIYANIDVELFDQQSSQSSLDLINNATIVLAEKTFSAEVELFNEIVPIDPDFIKKEMAKGLKENLDSGFITQDEYDFAMNQEWPYAQIVE